MNENWLDQFKNLEPEEFEKKRTEFIQQYLTENFEGERLEKAQRLQWRIDQERRHYKNPVACASKLNTMMMQSLFELNDVLHGRLPDTKNRDATIIEFKNK